MHLSKFFNVGKLTCFLIMFSLFTAVGCSSSDDEPDTPDDSGSVGYVSYSIFPGTWTIESVTDSKGVVTPINQTFTIAPFDVKQESGNDVSAGNLETWAENYENFYTYTTAEGLQSDDSLVEFVKEKGKPLSSTIVYGITFTFENYDGNGYRLFSLTDLSYSNNMLIAQKSGYSDTSTGNLKTEMVTVKMKKI